MRPVLVRRRAAAVVVAGVAGTAALLLGPAWPAVADSPEAVRSYDTTIAVQADGQLRVTETLVYDFGANPRHGIERRIPDRLRYDDHRDRRYPISAVGVTVDGHGVPDAASEDGGYRVLRIGDPDRTVIGTHTYAISYTVGGALNHFADHEELTWNAVGTEWTVPVTAADATVTGPVAATRIACYAGPAGSTRPCGGAQTGPAGSTFRQLVLGAGEGLTVVAAFPGGSVHVGAPILVERRDLAAGFHVTPATVAGGAGVAVLSVLAALLLVWRFGRDRRYAGLLPGLTPETGDAVIQQRKPLTGAPPVSVEFTPPHDVRPGQVGALIDEKADVVDVTATIVDFAVRRHLHIAELPAAGKGAGDWELTRLTEGDPAFLPYERELFAALFRGRDRVRLSELRATFAGDLSRVRQALDADLVTQGWYERSPAATRIKARLAAVLVLVLAGAATVALALTVRLGVPGLGLVVGAVVLIAVAGRVPGRTGKGSAMLERVKGFRLYVATAEKDQIAFQERAQIFSRYLPYAMVFGLVDRWAKTFADIGTGDSGGLYWYTGRSGWSMVYFAHSIDGFTTSTSSALAATPASASGGSGFSSAGFSGGGGGGGGGGSW